MALYRLDIHEEEEGQDTGGREHRAEEKTAVKTWKENREKTKIRQQAVEDGNTAFFVHTLRRSEDLQLSL